MDPHTKRHDIFIPAIKQILLDGGYPISGEGAEWKEQDERSWYNICLKSGWKYSVFPAIEGQEPKISALMLSYYERQYKKHSDKYHEGFEYDHAAKRAAQHKANYDMIGVVQRGKRSKLLERVAAKKSTPKPERELLAPDAASTTDNAKIDNLADKVAMSIQRKMDRKIRTRGTT